MAEHHFYRRVGNSLSNCQEPTETSKQPIRTHYLGHVTGYQPIRDQYFGRFLLTVLTAAHETVFLQHTSKQPIRTRYLGHVTGYQPIRDQYFLIWSIFHQSLSAASDTAYEESRVLGIKLRQPTGLYKLEHCTAWNKFETDISQLPDTKTWTLSKTPTTLSIAYPSS
eukprot:sb/3472412/